MSLHRFRGNFANIVDKYVKEVSMCAEVTVLQEQTKEMLGHSKNNFLNKDYLGEHLITQKILGEYHDLTQDSYVLSQDTYLKILAIKAFDSLPDIFKYRKQKSKNTELKDLQN